MPSKEPQSDLGAPEVLLPRETNPSRRDACYLPRTVVPRLAPALIRRLTSFQLFATRPLAPQPHARWRESQAGLMRRAQRGLGAQTGLGAPSQAQPPLWPVPPCREPPSLTQPSPTARRCLKTRSDFLVLFPRWCVLFPSRPWEVLQILLIWKPIHWVARLVWPKPLILAFLSSEKKLQKTKPESPQMGLSLWPVWDAWFKPLKDAH